MSKSQFKVSQVHDYKAITWNFYNYVQVTNEALLDVYKAIGSTFSLRKCLIKFV